MRLILIFVTMVMLSISIQAAEKPIFTPDQLPLGNPDTKYNYCAVKLDHILATHTGEELTLAQLIDRLKEYRIIMVGEGHTTDSHHRVQLNVIKGLTEAGVTVCLALEMFNPEQNDVLEAYRLGQITEDEFIGQSAYFDVWGHNYRYYQPIFQYVAEKQIKMYGVNVARDYATKIGRGGLNSLTEEELAQIPEVDLAHIEHRFYIKTQMEGMDATMPEQFSHIYEAQSLWDTAMGEGVIKAAQENPDAVVVVLAGSGHVVYNIGIGRIIEGRSDFPFASLVAVDVPDSTEESPMMQIKKSIKDTPKDDTVTDPKMDEIQPEEGSMMVKSAADTSTSMMAVHRMPGMGLTDDTPSRIVICSLADYLWGVEMEEREKYPSFGFSLDDKTEEGFPIKRIFPETIAEQQGLQKGDVIAAINGQDFADYQALKKYLTYLNWNDPMKFDLWRAGDKVTVEFLIDYQEKDPCADQ